MVAEGPFVSHLAWVDDTFQYDLCTGRDLQIGAATFHQLGTLATQQARERVLRETVGHGRYGTEDGRRVGAQRYCDRKRFARMLVAPVLEIQRTTAVAQPAHDQLVAADDLLAINAQVLPLFIGSAGDHQAPGYKRSGVARPAGLDGYRREVDILALHDHSLTGCVTHDLGCHGYDFSEDRQFRPGILQPFRRIGFLQERK